MAQAFTRQEQSAPEDGISSAEAARNAGEAPFSGSCASASVSNISQHEYLACSGTDDEPAVRRWQELIGSSLALEEQAEASGRWNMRQSVPFLICLSAVLWALLFMSALQVL